MKKESSVSALTLTVTQAVQELRAGQILQLVSEDGRKILYLAGQFAREQTIASLLVGSASGSIVVGNDYGDITDIFPVNRGMGVHEIAGRLRVLMNPFRRREEIQRLRRSVESDVAGQPHKAVLSLLRIAGLEPLAVVCESDTYQQNAFLSLEAVAQYQQRHRISLISETSLPTMHAPFRLRHYQDLVTGQPYLALCLGKLDQGRPLVRLHSACATGDIFGSQRCDCQAQLHLALQEIAREGQGVLLYLPQEGRGIGLSAKLQAYRLQEQGFDTIAANEHLGYPIDGRDYVSASAILRDLSLTHIRLLTNNPDKVRELIEHGIRVERVPLEVAPGQANAFYLWTKFERMGHLLSLSSDKPIERQASGEAR